MANLFMLPRFENQDKNVKARLIFLISAGMAIASLIFVVVSLFAIPALRNRALILAMLVIPGTMASMWFVHHLKLRIASGLLLVIVWFSVTLGTLSAGGVSAPITIGYMFAITISGLLMTRRTSTYITAVCIAFGMITAWAEMNGWLPAVRSYSPIERISIYSFFFVLVLGLQNITAWNIQQLLHQARESETKYKSFLESIPTITYISDLTLEARTEYVSPQVEDLLGYSQEEFSKDPTLWKKIVHPE